MIDAFSYVLNKKQSQMISTGSIITLTNNMSSYSACDSNDNAPLIIVNNEILIEALRFKKKVIDNKFVFSFNASKFKQMASLTFSSGKMTKELKPECTLNCFV